MWWNIQRMWQPSQHIKQMNDSVHEQTKRQWYLNDKHICWGCDHTTRCVNKVWTKLTRIAPLCSSNITPQLLRWVDYWDKWRHIDCVDRAGIDEWRDSTEGLPNEMKAVLEEWHSATSTLMTGETLDITMSLTKYKQLRKEHNKTKYHTRCRQYSMNIHKSNKQ